MIVITITHGVYKPTNIAGGHHLVEQFLQDVHRLCVCPDNLLVSNCSMYFVVEICYLLLLLLLILSLSLLLHI